jgi:predicted aspartyl protease
VNKFRLLGFIVLFLFLFCFPATSGKVYKWRDEQGRLHFSDTAPIETDSTQNLEEFESDTISSTPAAKENSQESQPAKTSDIKKKDGISIPYVSKVGTADVVIINVTFDGRVTVPMMVDTGSTGLVLFNSLAYQLGLFSKDSSILITFLSGIGGVVLAGRTFVDEISIDGIKEKFIPARIVSDVSDAFAGLIGMDILSNYTLTIDSSKNRLILNLNPESKELPGGRNRSWWENTFREFGAYRDVFNTYAELAVLNKYPFSEMSDREREDWKKSLLFNREKARDLYQKLENYARWNRVPTHWRK